MLCGYWLAGPVSHSSPSSSISISDSASLWPFPSVLPYLCVSLAGLSHLSFSISVSLSASKCLCPSTALSLSISCLSPSLSLPVSAGSSGSGRVRDSPARAPLRTMPHSRGQPAPWQRARPARPACGPLVPRGCHGYVRRVPAPRAREGAGPAGGARRYPLPGVRAPSRGLQPLIASVSPSVKHRGWVE